MFEDFLNLILCKLINPSVFIPVDQPSSINFRLAYEGFSSPVQFTDLSVFQDRI